MKLRLAIVLCFCATRVFAQLSSAHQKSLNAYSTYANKAGEEVSAVIQTAFRHFQVVNSSYPEQYSYICPFQLDDYFLNAVNANSKNLPPSVLPELNKSFDRFKAAMGKVDKHCKALDTYYKLQDYKKDNFAQARQSLEDLKPIVADFWKEYRDLQLTMESVKKKLHGSPSGPYYNADLKLFKIVSAERQFLDNWKLNFNEEKYSGWSSELLEKSIAESATALAALKVQQSGVKYPASSMWSNFIESYGNYIDIKRNMLDEHNFQATQNDKHNNDSYLNLINYFNGTLVADYNTFLQFSSQDGYYGVNTFRYVPAFDIIRNTQQASFDIKPYADLPYEPINVVKQKTAISKNIFNALNEYVTFINETFFQVRSLRTTLIHFNGRANDYYRITDYSKRAPMKFEFEKFQVPLSYYQKVISLSKSLPPGLVKSLNNQAEVLLNILKEMEAQGAGLVNEVTQRNYEKDKFKKIYQILEREAVLLKDWDEKKERFYSDVRLVFDSYPPANPGSSWQISGQELRKLVDLNHVALFEAKAFYNGDTLKSIDTAPIEAHLRQIIANEYENMKGIQKLGRYNGMCPYSPYEDIPNTSRTLVEYFTKLEKRTSGYSRYSDPYYNMIYLYNDIVEDYNTFSELSVSTPHLKSIMQPEMFSVGYPEEVKKNMVKVVKSDEAKQEVKTSNAIDTATNDVAENKNQPITQEQNKSASVFKRDTIYIEKRDTIYIREPNEDLRSMEGYATNNMVLLLDVSGSMNQPDKLPLLKESMLRMLDMMRQEDKITIIIFASKPKVLLEATSFKDEQKIKKAVSNLSSSGKTDGKAAIKVAYKVADANYIRGGNNRIILATDGEFVINEETEKLISDFSGNDIFLSVFNFGKGMGASKTLEHLARIGKGNYESISSENVDVKLIREAKAKKRK